MNPAPEALETGRIVLFTLAAAAAATILNLAPGIAVAWAMSRRRWRGRTVVETLVSLPLVLPPTAVDLTAGAPVWLVAKTHSWRVVG